MKIFTKENKFPIIILILLIGILVVYSAIFNSFGYTVGVLGVALMLGICLIVDIEQSYYVLAFCFPFARILKLSVASFSVVPLFFALIILKLFVFKKQKLKLAPLICFLIFTAMQIFSVIIYNAPITGVISFLLSAFFVLYSASYLSSDNDCSKTMIKNAGLFLAIGVAVSIMVCDIFPNVLNWVNRSEQELLEADNRFGALFMEPNEFSQIVLVAIGFLIATFSSYKKVIAKIGIISLMLYLIINGLRSNSKSYVITLFGLLCVLMIIYAIKFFKKKRSAIAIIGFMVMIVVGLLAGYYLIFNVIIPVFELRGESSDLLTGRDRIWGTYIDAILQRIDVAVIGCGAGNVTAIIKLANADMGRIVPHSVYLEYLVQFGIVGITMLAISWADVFRSMRQKSTWLWIPAWAFLLTAFGISANSNDCIFIIMVLLCMPFDVYSDVRSKG